MTLSYEFLKAELTGDHKIKSDSYLNSPLYYLITGRKGAWLYKNHHAALIVCAHPHIPDRLLVFPEIGKADYELTSSVLNMLDPPSRGVQLARYSEEEVIALRQQLAKLNCTPVSGVSIADENILDWRYPVRILDTAVVAAAEGGEFQTIRRKFHKAANSNVSHASLEKDNAFRWMRAVLKFWEGTMISNAKDTDDMSASYLELLKIMESHPETINGLSFSQGRRPVGFCIWDQPGKEVANLLVNLGDITVTGLSDYQMITLCRDLLERGIKYLNIGGSETQNLDAFKAKYSPAKSIKILSADVIYRKPDHPKIEIHTLVEGQWRTRRDSNPKPSDP